MLLYEIQSKLSDYFQVFGGTYSLHLQGRIVNQISARHRIAFFDCACLQPIYITRISVRMSSDCSIEVRAL
jgi:hypothetical protein